MHAVSDAFLAAATTPAPVCGRDFCEACSDCLVCCAEDRCYGTDDGEHVWVPDPPLT